MHRAVASWALVAALCGCGRLGYGHGSDGGSSGPTDASIDASPETIDGGDEPIDAGPIDASVADASVRDAGMTDGGSRDAGPPDAGPPDASTLDAGTCTDPLTIGVTTDATVRSTVMAAAMPTPDRGEESDVMLFVATSCFDPADPTPLIDALEMHPDPQYHPIQVMYGGGAGPIGGLSPATRATLDFPGDVAGVADALDVWGGAPGRYYTGSAPSVPCAGCEGGVSYNYFVYPATGRIAVAFGGWSR